MWRLTNMTNVYENLERLFHEPSRLAIMTALTGERGAISFSDLKDSCELTDGNLSRHLSALEKGGAVRIEKSFVGAKPRTSVSATSQGRKDFLRYLANLEEVLAAALSKAGRQRNEASLPHALSKPIKS
jgi:DNA-binding MarR family transcriptional regulator